MIQLNLLMMIWEAYIGLKDEIINELRLILTAPGGDQGEYAGLDVNDDKYKALNKSGPYLLKDVQSKITLINGRHMMIEKEPELAGKYDPSNFCIEKV